jgi:ureidoglycolate hydrolase
VLSPTGKPTSEGTDYTYWSDLAHYVINGETEIGLCHVYRQPRAEIRGMERHLRTPELLIPIDGPFLLPLLLEGQPSSEARVFRVNVGEAIVMDPGVWHGACFPADRETSSYFVIFRRKTPFEDIEKKDVDPFHIGSEA